MFWGSSWHPSRPLGRPEILQGPGALEYTTKHQLLQKRPLDQPSSCAAASDGIQGLTCHPSLNLFVPLHRSYQLKTPLPDFNAIKFIFCVHLLSVQKKGGKGAWPCTPVHPIYEAECFLRWSQILWPSKDVFLIQIIYCLFPFHFKFSV